MIMIIQVGKFSDIIILNFDFQNLELFQSWSANRGGQGKDG